MQDREARRAFLLVAGAGALLAACRRKEGRAEAQPPDPTALPGEREPKGSDVTALEDLMREHGVIRRALVVYREAAARLRAAPRTVPPDALHGAASLLRTFGEDYHERQLEEMHLFPAVRGAGGPAAALVDTLVEQHRRGRAITDYVLATTTGPIAPANALPLARTLDSFARMYAAHAAMEDTVVFPAWKATLSPGQYDEMGDLFEAIERRTLGTDGFDEAVDRVSSIERRFGIDLASLTAPPPPRG